MTLYSPSSAPICPDCSVQMIERTNGSTGEKFFGCPNFPKCRNSEAIEDDVLGFLERKE